MANGAAAGSGFYADLQTSAGVYKYYFDGQWLESKSGASVAVTNPTTRQTAYHLQGTSISPLRARSAPTTLSSREVPRPTL